MIIKMIHIRKAGYCSRGARVFFERHGLDWTEFLLNGIDASKLVATGDAMAIKVVELAHG